MALPRELSWLLTRTLATSSTYSATTRFGQHFIRRSHSSAAKASPYRLILGLESSADDSCASVVSSHGQILSNIVIKQNDLLAKWGGIQPLHAQQAHQRNMPLAIEQALSQAGVGLKNLHGIAFTRGPGMYGCLSQCGGAAKALAAATGLPLLGVHHMAHALTPFLTETTPPTFPFLTLLLSGGHTLLLLARSESNFKILATTQDESIGASLDKASRALEIPLELGNGSAGAALEAFAFGAATPIPSSSPESPPPAADPLNPSLDPSHTSDAPSALPAPSFPLPFRRQLAFSYSGARSALTRLLVQEPVAVMSEERKKALASAFMRTAFEQVGEKVGLGIELFEKEQEGDATIERLGGLVVSGGVASNLYLRKSLRATLDKLGYPDMPLIFPPPHLCTDNAAMIAHVGHSRLARGRLDPLTVDLKAKWSIEECEADFEGAETEDEA